MDLIGIHNKKFPCHQTVVFSFYSNSRRPVQHIDQLNGGMPVGRAVPSLLCMVGNMDPCFLKLEQRLINHFLQINTSVNVNIALINS